MMSDPPAVFRFAPSPNGKLHLGHARSALINLRMARSVGGKMLLRFEDIDQARCTPALEKQMLEDLEWLGFEWDGEPLRQSNHFGAYREALSELDRKGMIYASYLTRSEIRKRVTELEASGTPWPCDPDGSPLYPGDEGRLPAKNRGTQIGALGRQVLRLDTEAAMSAVDKPLSWIEMAQDPDAKPGIMAADVAAWGDVALARRDTPTSYHLSCVIDDAHQGITHVVRGKDLYPATSIHRLLQELLNLQEPEYHHHALVLDENGRKLSKSDRSTSLQALREAGVTPAQISEKLGLWE